MGVPLILTLATVRVTSGNLLPALPMPIPQLFTTFAWNSSPSEEVTGYAVYYGITGLGLTNRIDVGNSLSITLPLLVGLPHSIYVVAYADNGVESQPSNVVEYSPPAMTPLRLSRSADGLVQLRFRTSPLAICAVEWTPSLEFPTWQTLGLGLLMADTSGDVVVNDPEAAGFAARYYRALKY